MVLALTLALPTGAAFAESDVVRTRSDQNVHQQFGRDSVYAFSPESKLLMHEQTSAGHGDSLGGIKSYAANAWHKTESFTGAAWDKVTDVFTRDPTYVSQIEPEPYGRAGGYVGSDRVAVLYGPLPHIANAEAKSPDLGVAEHSHAGTNDSHRMANAAEMLSETGDASATDGSGYTEERDPERMPNGADSQ